MSRSNETDSRRPKVVNNLAGATPMSCACLIPWRETFKRLHMDGQIGLAGEEDRSFHLRRHVFFVGVLCERPSGTNSHGDHSPDSGPQNNAELATRP